MGIETLVYAALVSLLGVAPGIEGSYQENTNHGNVLHHVLRVVHPAEANENFQASPEVFQRHQQQPLEYYQPEQPQDQLFQQVAKQQYVVHSGHDIASHQPTDQQQQRQIALPYNNQRLHVNVDYQRGPHSQAHSHPHPLPISHHQQLALEPKKDYRELIPKSIAPKLNPLHHSFHQKRNFVPLHHITRQVPVPPAQHAFPNGHQQVKIVQKAPTQKKEASG
ncbi:uncharacterized protein LOC131215367 [Anopheles bellator]|uniref:uncharacterized protein LOC131215367 n=1 Tax=Anopheles bellator TaxID=139047 RepID=UPI00264880C9|nr:uncharacterized protein LOC131215367 [Anopheles bellator]